jgi:hypothetical protein
MQEADQRIQKTELQIERTSKEVGKITDSIGRLVENMVGGDSIIGKFQALGYKIARYSRNQVFGLDLPEEMRGEVDLLLEDGTIVILIEVKTTLRPEDVSDHMETLEKYRRVADIKGDKRRFIGAVAGATVKGEARKFAQKNGMYVIVQSGEAVEILPVPEGFNAREW